MDIRFKCPSCNAALKASEDLAGKQARCRQCGTTFRIPSCAKDPSRHSEALGVVAEAENLFQDNSGVGEEEWSDALTRLSPESIEVIAKRGWHKRGPAEATNEFLVRVLARVAEERSPAERKAAVGVLRSVLDLPDDNTVGHMRLRGACIRELGGLNALPGAEPAQPLGEAKSFRLRPIERSQVGPVKSNPPDDQPNLESQALWQLVLDHEYEEVVARFERSYPSWSKTFDTRSESLVLCAYGRSLEELKRYDEAVLAHRWACKFYPYRGYTSCDILDEVEAKAAEATRRK